MEDKDKVIQDLFSRLDLLSRQQKVFHDEIQNIHRELQKLRDVESKASNPDDIAQPAAVKTATAQTLVVNTQSVPAPSATPPYPPFAQKSKTPWEDFIGKNLLNKVGIAVLVLGIALG